MAGSVDTNVLIRHLTGDPPEQAKRATKLLAETTPLQLRQGVSFDKQISRVGTIERIQP
ncbi:MAG: hypothetical protein M3Y77_00335 [Actinomycetota bacterium]|nr:hypothetical protein [Actinomycetota bacterium]